jgi:DNA-binding IclR family transcriptional regulator
VEQLSGVGVLDKSVAVLDALAEGPVSLGALVVRTGLPRPTAHRLVTALEAHRLAARDGAGRFMLGPRLAELASSAADPLLLRAPMVLRQLRDDSGESTQLYLRDGDARRCVATADRAGTGLRDVVPVGALLPLTAGSAAQVLLAWSSETPPADTVFSPRLLAAVRRRGWAASVGERERGLASVSAPVLGRPGGVVAAVSVSGPVERLGRNPGDRFAPLVVAAAERLQG